MNTCDTIKLDFHLIHHSAKASVSEGFSLRQYLVDRPYDLLDPRAMLLGRSRRDCPLSSAGLLMFDPVLVSEFALELINATTQKGIASSQHHHDFQQLENLLGVSTRDCTNFFRHHLGIRVKVIIDPRIAPIVPSCLHRCRENVWPLLLLRH
jgi:hypothetical protein